MMNDILPIAAGDVWSVLVPIVFFIIYVINHLISAKGKAPPARNPQRRPPQGAERPLRPQQPVQQIDPLRGDPSQLNAEIEQFLKRAGQRRGEKAGGGPPPKAPPRPPRESRRDTRREQPVDVASLDRPQLSSVSATVEKHLEERARGFTQRAEHLADDIVRSDQQMEDHLQKAFSHRVGSLSDSAPKTSTTPATDNAPQVTEGISPVAAGVIAILADPKTMRQAVVLSEILARPEHRW